MTNPSTVPNPTSTKRRHTFRAALLLLVLGSLVLTVGTVGLVAFYNSLQTMDQLRYRQYSIMMEVMTREVTGLLGQAPPLLQSQKALAERGLLPMTSHSLLGFYFAETLRSRPHLTWLSYGEAEDGRFVGARRDAAGRVLVHFSDPSINEGRGREFIVSTDGTWTPYAGQEMPPFDARKRPWFQNAAREKGLVWSPVYVFFEGTPGLTASLALRDEEGGLRGVFTADFSLRSIDEFLDAMARQRTSYLAVAGADGTLVGEGTSLEISPEETTDTVLGALDAPLSEISFGENRPFRFHIAGQNMIGVAGRVEPLPGFESVLITAVGEREFFGPVFDNAVATGAIGAVALLISSLIAFFIAARLGRPLADISADLARVSAFQLERVEKPGSSLAEIAQLHRSVETMKTGLRAFRRYVPTQLVRRLLELGQDAELGGVERELTILFSDLANFTKISENLRPSQIVEEMREYFEVATEAVENEKGTLDKFLGDGILAFYNAPADLIDHAVHGCATALALQEGLAAGEVIRQQQGRPLLKARIGLHTGLALVGNIGTHERFTYTVIGDSANLAARLESLNKTYGTEILASDSTRMASGDRFLWRKIDRVAVVGREGVTVVHELRREMRLATPGEMEFIVRYEKALESYFQGEFGEAVEEFSALAEEFPEDRATRLLLERCRQLQKSPPGKWTGVFISSSK